MIAHTNLGSRGVDHLDGKKLDVGGVEERGVDVSQVDHTPSVRQSVSVPTSMGKTQGQRIHVHEGGEPEVGGGI